MQSDAPGEAEATGGAEATGDAPRADAPTRPPSPPVEVFYGPATRGEADDAAARNRERNRDDERAGQADQDVALGTDVPHLEVPTQSPSRGVLYGPETHRESIIRAEYARKDGLIAQARAFSRRNTRSARGAYVPDPIVSKGAYRQCVVALGELDVNAEPEPRQVATVRSARFGGECPVCWEAWADEDAPDYPGEIRFCCAKMFCHACWLRLIGKPCPLCRVPWPRDGAEFLARIQHHAENLVPEALERLGSEHFGGHLGLVTCGRTAADYWMRAAIHGDVRSMIKLGWLYQFPPTGSRVEQDLGVAMVSFEMAADRGDAEGQYEYARFLRDHAVERFDDHTVERFDSETENFLKLETVFAYMRLAADQGYGDAMRYLGNLYRDGTGVEADADEAQRWHARAAAKGK